MLINVDTELGAKDLLNNRMAYVAVSCGAYDLGDHLKAAIRYHFKTGHRETA